MRSSISWHSLGESADHLQFTNKRVSLLTWKYENRIFYKLFSPMAIHLCILYGLKRKDWELVTCTWNTHTHTHWGSRQAGSTREQAGVLGSTWINQLSNQTHPVACVWADLSPRSSLSCIAQSWFSVPLLQLPDFAFTLSPPSCNLYFTLLASLAIQLSTGRSQTEGVKWVDLTQRAQELIWWDKGYVKEH